MDDPTRYQMPSQSPWPALDPVSRLIIAVWGLTGNNGLTGTSKDHETRIRALETFAAEIRQIRDGIRWLALGLLALIGWAMTDPVATVIARVVRAAAGG